MCQGLVESWDTKGYFDDTTEDPVEATKLQALDYFNNKLLPKATEVVFSVLSISK